MQYFDLILFGIFPYVAFFSFVLFSILRYTKKGYSYSSMSSQFVENRIHFWALVPFHFGIIFVLLGHLAALITPNWILAWNSSITRLYILEVSAFIGAIFALTGLFFIIMRRLFNARTYVITSKMDWVVLTVLFLQLSTGLMTALNYQWGSSWFTATATPYIKSIFHLQPDISLITPLPAIFKWHVIGNWTFFLLFPFTRLVHVLVIPNPYLWRRPQVVRWNWDKRKRFI